MMAGHSNDGLARLMIRALEFLIKDDWWFGLSARSV
jgi:hypothetical protein